MAAAILLGTALTPRARAATQSQNSTPDPNEKAGAQSAVDPPARVGRIGWFEGHVSFSQEPNAWIAARLNTPLTAGEAVWVDARGRAELHLGALALRLGPQTLLNIQSLDDAAVQVSVPQGTVSVVARTLEPHDSVEIDTPRGFFTLSAAGVYRAEVQSGGRAAQFTVRVGSALVGKDAQTLLLSAGHQVHVDETTQFATLRPDGLPGTSDSFDTWVDARARREAKAALQTQVSPDMVGYEDLDEGGQWFTAPAYGAVWAPFNVSQEWAPFQDGQWQWDATYGWNWLDDAPWGFATSHYGRWVFADGQWVWTPPSPWALAYAPAVVSFLELNAFADGLNATEAYAAWFALAPGEAYRPPYLCTPAYLNRINGAANTNPVAGANRPAPRGVTTVTRRTLIEGRPVAFAQTPLSARATAQAPAVGAVPPGVETPKTPGPQHAITRLAAPAAVPPYQVAHTLTVPNRSTPRLALPHPASRGLPRSARELGRVGVRVVPGIVHLRVPVRTQANVAAAPDEQTTVPGRLGPDSQTREHQPVAPANPREASAPITHRANGSAAVGRTQPAAPVHPATPVSRPRG